MCVVNFIHLHFSTFKKCKKIKNLIKKKQQYNTSIFIGSHIGLNLIKILKI